MKRKISSLIIIMFLLVFLLNTNNNTKIIYKDNVNFTTNKYDAEIKFKETSLILSNNIEYKLEIITTPSEEIKNITWTSSNPNVISVNNGKIKTLKYGEAIITAKLSNNKKSTCKVKVINPKYKKYCNKKLSIIGDSISTFEGYIPIEYKTCYPRGEINTVYRTWWNKVSRITGMDILSNCSWSGSTCIGDDKSNINAYAACSNKRIRQLAKNTEKPDVIICYIGTNDYHKGIGLTKNYINNSTNNFNNAYSIMLSKIKLLYPDASIYCCTLYNTSKKINRCGNTIEDYNKIIIQVANEYECNIIDLYNCGIKPNYTYTIDNVHPNILGMKLIKNTVLNELLK